jgi:hypothetical protein
VPEDLVIGRLLSDDFDEYLGEDDSQRFVWLALVKNAWRRERDFVVLRAETAGRSHDAGALPCA